MHRPDALRALVLVTASVVVVGGTQAADIPVWEEHR